MFQEIVQKHFAKYTPCNSNSGGLTTRSPVAQPEKLGEFDFARDRSMTLRLQHQGEM